MAKSAPSSCRTTPAAPIGPAAALIPKPESCTSLPLPIRIQFPSRKPTRADPTWVTSVAVAVHRPADLPPEAPQPQPVDPELAVVLAELAEAAAEEVAEASVEAPSPAKARHGPTSALRASRSSNPPGVASRLSILIPVTTSG